MIKKKREIEKEEEDKRGGLGREVEKGAGGGGEGREVGEGRAGKYLRGRIRISQ